MNNSYTHEVQYYETDQMGVTHHSNYIRWMEEARLDFFKKRGYDYKILEKEKIICPVIGINGKYKKTTTFGDVVNITVYVSLVKGIKLEIFYQMKVDGTLVFEGTSEHAFMTTDMKFMRLESDFPEFHKLLMEENELYLKTFAK